MIDLTGASCAALPVAQVDAMFFEESTHGWRDAVALCSACPVQQACKQWAEDELIPQGIFGGERGGARRKRLGIPKHATVSLFEFPVAVPGAAA